MDYGYVLKIAAAPLALLAIAALLGWFFRRSILRSMNLSPAEIEHETQEPTVVQTALRLPALSIRRVELSASSDPTAQSTLWLSEHKRTVRATGLAYVAAALAYTVVSTSIWVMTLAASAHPRFPVDLAWGMIYILQCLPLVIVVWFLRVSRPVLLAVLGGYLLLGIGLVLAESDISRAAAIAKALVVFFLLYPLIGLLLLCARPLRPWLIALVAILVYVLSSMAVWILLPQYRVNLGETKYRLAAGFGLIFLASAVVLVGWMLRRRSWRLPVAVLIVLALAGTLLIKLLPNSLSGYVLIALPSNVLQVFFVWLVFKTFVLLQQQEFLPGQMLQSHVCWGFLTFYFWLSMTSMIGHHQWGTWAIVSAYGLYLVLFHALLRRIWAARVNHSAKRLLLLRVYGTAGKREKLLDLLDDTWRYVGRTDLIAGTDLAIRTLRSRMLEAFFLLQADDQFLRTEKDVDRRLARLDSRLEGDARYPVNSVYCYTTAWRHAVQRLAPESDVVLMDLRGFTHHNRGCIFELNWLIHRIKLSRVILLTDATTDSQTLEETIQTAWSDLPVDSPNASIREPTITILNGTMRSKDSGRALFVSLLEVAGSVATIS